MNKYPAVLAVALLAGGLFAESPKTGLKPGAKIPGPFSPLNVTGDDAGQKRCQVCKNGQNPVVMIFARETSAPLTALLKKVDRATAHNGEAKLGSFAVFLSDAAEEMEKKLTELAGQAKLKHIILTIDGAGGPSDYQIARDADVIVVLYSKYTVKANFTYRKGELNDGEVAKVLETLPKILNDK